jgi:MFS family permease
VVCELGTQALNDEDERPSRLLSWPFVVVMLSGFVYFTAVGAQIPAAPRYIEEEMQGGGLQVGIGVGAFAVSAVLLRPWIGQLGDVHGRRVLVVGGAIVAGISVMLYPLATTLPVFVGLRLLTGAGEAAFFTAVITVSQDLAPDDRRGEAASYFSVCLYGGLAVGPPIAERLLRTTSFTTVFVVFGLCCLAAAVLGLRVPHGPGGSADVLPAGSGTADVSASSRWRRLTGMVYVPAVWPGIVLALGVLPLIALASFLPLYIDEVGLDDAGAVLGVYAGLILAVRILGARLPDILGWSRASTWALCGGAAGISLIGLWGSVTAVWLGTITMAIGLSLLFPALLSALVGSTPASERNQAVATFMMFFDISQGLGAALVGGVVSLSSQRGGFVFAGMCALAGLGALFLLRDRIGATPQPQPAS